MRTKTLVICLIMYLLFVAIAANAQFNDEWQDKSPHKSAFVTSNGVRLHYLDWDGKGDALLFLPGLNQSAHIFDALAPQFKDKFRVIALTRRGQGESDKPENGYDTASLTEDLKQFLDELKIKRVTLVGHSMAGKELTLFTAFREYFKKSKCGWSEAWEAEMRATVVFAPDSKPLRPVTPDKVTEQLVKGMRASNPDYTKIKAPALAFYVLDPFPECAFPPHLSEAERTKMQLFMKTLRGFLKKSADRFRRELPKAKIVEMQDTDHWFFIQNQPEVVREMREFLLN